MSIISWIFHSFFRQELQCEELQKSNHKWSLSHWDAQNRQTMCNWVSSCTIAWYIYKVSIGERGQPKCHYITSHSDQWLNHFLFFFISDWGYRIYIGDSQHITNQFVIMFCFGLVWHWLNCPYKDPFTSLRDTSVWPVGNENQAICPIYCKKNKQKTQEKELMCLHTEKLHLNLKVRKTRKMYR